MTERRFRFSLSTLMAVVFVAALVFAGERYLPGFFLLLLASGLLVLSYVVSVALGIALFLVILRLLDSEI